jgi:NhaP-type Na+/H+ and K+/H+ antiporter
MSFVYFVLCSYGLTQILAFSKIFDSIRPKHHFFHCAMCLGFWVGIFLMTLNPYTELFTFKVSLVNALLLGSLSSATSYALCMIISDGGIRLEQRTKGSLDAKVDVTPRNKLLSW